MGRDKKDKNMFDPDDLNNVDTSLLAATVFAGLCGVLSELINVSEGKAFSWKAFLLHACVSAVAGLITYQVLVSLGTASGMASAMSGVAGWMGTDAIKLIKVLLLRRVGVDPKELDKIKEEEGKHD